MYNNNDNNNFDSEIFTFFFEVIAICFIFLCT